MRVAMAAALAALGIVFAPAGVRADVGDYLGRPVGSVRLEIEGRQTADPQLQEVLETRVGEPLSLAAVRRTIGHLFGLGRFENVVADAADGPDGIALRYELTPIHPIGRITFTGLSDRPGVDAGALRGELTSRYGASPPAGRSAEMARFIEEELRQRGYLAVRASTSIAVEHSPHRSTLTFAVEPGVRTAVGGVELKGAAGEALAALRQRLDTSPGDPYEPRALAAAIEEHIAARRRAGYYEARVTLTSRFSSDDRIVDLLLTVDDGPRIRVALRGDALPGDRRDELVPVAAEGSADEDLLEDSTIRIEEYLRERGYRDAAAPYERQRSGGELLVAFDVRRGPLYRVSDVVVSGNASIPLAEFAPGFRVRPDEPFSDAALDADVAALEDLYRRAGFTAVDIQSGVEPLPGSGAGAAEIPVTVRMLITENARTLVGSVAVEGNGSVPDAALLAGLGLQPGRPFYATQLAIDRDAIARQYADLGYQTATVTSDPGLSEDGRTADVRFRVREGARVFVDHVLIVGNDRTRRETIARELQLQSGDPLGLAAITESQRRLASLGLFRRTRITQIDHGDETRRDLLVVVEEAPATTIGYGGGAEVRQRIRQAATAGGIATERLEFAPRAFFEVSRRNLFGKNRSVSVFTRLSLRPNDVPVSPAGDPAAAGAESRFGFSEYRVLGTFREPRVFGTLGDAILTGTIEQQIRSSFNFARLAFAAEGARALTRHTSVTGNYQIQRTRLFDERLSQEERLLIDRLFPQVRLSSFSVSGVRDSRDDQLNPLSGGYFSANAQLAARGIGSEVGLWKSFLTAQLFRTLPTAGQVVLASSARVGLASGFPREVPRLDPAGQPVIGPDGLPAVDVIRELPASERFFAGGDTTVRGFALDQLGTRETIDQFGFPIGGNALVILNAELRVPVGRGLGLVGFFDTGNVFARTSDIDLGELRSAVGFGFRYNSPVGPIRVDVGFKANRRDLVPGTPEALTAWHISLGQAF